MGEKHTVVQGGVGGGKFGSSRQERVLQQLVIMRTSVTETQIYHNIHSVTLYLDVEG